MEKKYLILSDIHGNLSALEAVLSDIQDEIIQGVIILGDLIDYGMRSDETVCTINKLSSTLWNGKILTNIWGNHEKILMDKKEANRLSSDRGRAMAKYTAEQLSKASKDYINKSMLHSGLQVFSIGELKCVAVHGSKEDCFWKSIGPMDLRGEYSCYDYVFSGHSHCSHFFSVFYDSDDTRMRNRKAVCFINPGSVGQPRNQNPYAQYAVLCLPSRQVELRSVKYNVAYEQSLYLGEIDSFYRDRLTYGI